MWRQCYHHKGYKHNIVYKNFLGCQTLVFQGLDNNTCPNHVSETLFYRVHHFQLKYNWRCQVSVWECEEFVCSNQLLSIPLLFCQNLFSSPSQGNQGKSTLCQWTNRINLKAKKVVVAVKLNSNKFAFRNYGIIITLEFSDLFSSALVIFNDVLVCVIFVKATWRKNCNEWKKKCQTKVSHETSRFW